MRLELKMCIETKTKKLNVTNRIVSNFFQPLEDRKVDIWVEQVFRGVRHPHPLNMLNVSFKTDFRLIPKHEEAKFTSYPVKELADAKTTTLPQTMDFPPLLERYIAKETGNQHPQLKVLLNRTKHNLNRYAEIGEEPTVKFPKNMGLGQPRSPNLYKNCGLTFDNQETK